MPENDTKIPYTLRASSRAKRLGISVHPGGHVIVTVPKARKAFFLTPYIEGFIEKHRDWLMRARKRLLHAAPALPGGKRDYNKNKERARGLVHERLKHLNQHYGFMYGRVSIRNTRTRWGSCSRKGNLNFNYKLIYLPSELVDYVVVHELCHLMHFDHSPRFWAEVARVSPEYKRLRRELRAITH